MTAPPRLAKRLLEWALPADVRDDVMRDFDELFEHRGLERGPRAARRWYWRQAARCAWSFAGARLVQARPESFVTDVIHALRSFRATPSFTAVALATLALGIGANVTVWSVVHHVLAQPLGYDAEERIVRVWPEHHFTRHRFETFRAEARSFDAFSGFVSTGLTLTGEGSPAVLRTLIVSCDHFDTFGVEPFIGRGFVSRDEHPGAEPVVIVSHRLWRERFGESRTVLGKRIDLGVPRTIVGVAPPGFRPMGREEDAWVPLTFDAALEEYTHMANVGVVAKLRASGTAETARAELEAIARRLDPPLYTLDEVPTYTVVGFRDSLVSTVRPTLALLLGAVSMVLLLCCLNVTNLLLARGVRREHELALRGAMGASRWRLFRQLLTESLVLGLVAGCIGFVVAWLGSSTVSRFIPTHVPRGADVSVDGDVAVLSFALSVIAALVFGLAPSIRASHPVSGVSSRQTSPTRRRLRVHRSLVAAQMALALALVAASGLLLRSFWQLQRVETGFRHEGLVSMRLSPSPIEYAEPEKKLQYYEHIFEALSAVPGVSDVGGIQILPMTPGSMGVGYSPTGEPLPPEVAPPMASYRIVTPGYRASVGVPLLSGRDLTAADRSGSVSVGLINAALARELSPGESPLGRYLAYDNGEPWFEIVGVVGNVHQHRLDRAPRPEVYLPLAQDAWPSSMFVLARTSAGGKTRELAPALRDAVWSVDADVPITSMHTMQEVVQASLDDPRIRTTLFAGFALLAFALSAIGVYGVMSYTVEARTHDVGIRVALGATARRVLGETLFGGMRPVAFGIVGGLILSLASTRALSSFLFDVDARDPLVYAAVALLLALTAVAAGWFPARRAAKADPLAALKVDG